MNEVPCNLAQVQADSDTACWGARYHCSRAIKCCGNDLKLYLSHTLINVSAGPEDYLGTYCRKIQIRLDNLDGL